jgi:hypothetical protein
VATLVRDAIEIVVRRLSTLPPSREGEELRAKAEEYLRGAEGWTAATPAAEESERLMRRVLELHIEVARLERW